MANKPSRSWIVLLNKVPRGPLSEDQVRALIKEGHLRTNDIAYEVPIKSDDPNAVKVTAEWKLLWQFPEFDRRNEKEAKTSWAGTGTPASAEKIAEERRHEPTEEELKQKARDPLPPEMLDIAPEDLVVHSTTNEPLTLAQHAEERMRPSIDINLPGAKVLWALGGILMLLVTVGVLRSKGGKPAEKTARTASTPDFGQTSERRGAPSARARAAGRSAQNPNTPRPVTPRPPEARTPANQGRVEEREPDRGEVDPPDEEVDEENEDSAPKAKIKPPTGNRRSRVLSDEQEEPDDGPGGDSPPPDDE